jgi:hypothetical protein
MAHVAFVCPDPAMWSMPGNDIVKAVPIDTCLNCSLTRIDRACHWDFADLKARIEGGYDEAFSPSRFNGCDRELYLRANNDFSTDPAEQTYRVRGTAAHAALEVDEPRVVGEARVYRALRGAVDHLGRPVVVGVKPDAVYPGLGLIADFKTWKYLPRGNVIKGQIDPQPVKPAVIRQLSVGAWAWADPCGVQYAGQSSTELRPLPIPITRAQESLRDGSGKGFLRQQVELMDFSKLEDWMRQRVLELNATRSGVEPGYCDESQRWKCGNCVVRDMCGIPKEMYVKPVTRRVTGTVTGTVTKERKPSARRSTKPN